MVRHPGPRAWFVGVQAAVAVVLRPGPRGPEVLLTQRAARAGDPWSGHVAFPGGRAHAGDRDLVQTAMRETQEEVGLVLARAAHRGWLGRRYTRMHERWAPMEVWAGVFWAEPGVQAGTSVEVDAAFWVPLAALQGEEHRTTREWRAFGRRWQMAAWAWEGHTIWGLTHSWLRRLLVAEEAHADALR